MKIGGLELIVVLVVLILVVGPERTIIYARKAGKWLRVLRVYLGSMTEELRETVVEPLQELQEPLREITQPFDELSKEVTGTVNEISKPFEDTVKDVRKSANELKTTTEKTLSINTNPKKAERKASAKAEEESDMTDESNAEETNADEPIVDEISVTESIAEEPEEELEMAQIIEEDPAPDNNTSPAIADIEEAGSETDELPEAANA
ncbi:MAG: hypothetical protein LUG61_04790 [Lachnospiraceae bacterium]|nr:hypothetical protein [Lachnospiraceae bacterium]